MYIYIYIYTIHIYYICIYIYIYIHVGKRHCRGQPRPAAQRHAILIRYDLVVVLLSNTYLAVII